MTIKPEYAQQEPSDGPRFGLLQSVLLLVVLMAVYLQTHAGASWLLVASGLAMALLAATVMVGGNRIARISIVVGLVLAVGALFRMPAPGGVFLEGIGRAQLFCSFFTAILMLREPAFRSGLLRRVGTFLVNQGERRRFVYLLSGSHVFGLMMHMGAVVLLGSMAAMPQENAGTRMEVAADRSQAAVAVIRGFAATTLWSPLSLTPVVVVSLVPGVEVRDLLWTGLFWALVSMALAVVVHLVGALWRGRGAADGTNEAVSHPVPWAAVWGLVALVLSVFLLISLGLRMTGTAVPAVVALVIPLFTLGWILAQDRFNLGRSLTGAISNLARRTIPSQTSEITVLMVAGFIGPFIVALVPTSDTLAWLGVHHVGPQAIALTCFLLVVGTGIVGISPIISIVVILGVISDPTALGIDPETLAMVFIVAWSLTAQSSPFTASSMLTSRMFEVTAATLVFRWNGAFCFMLAVMYMAGIVGGMGGF